MLPLNRMRVCPRCETKTDESGTFCPDCGTSFLREALQQSAVTIPRGAPAVDPNAATGSIEIDSTVSSLVGYTIDHQFVVESRLGGGTFGDVYRGRQLG